MIPKVAGLETMRKSLAPFKNSADTNSTDMSTTLLTRSTRSRGEQKSSSRLSALFALLKIAATLAKMSLAGG